MNLKDIRIQFIKQSGRYDLVVDTTNWADNGADFYINAGHMYFQRALDVPDVFSRIYRQVTPGSWNVDNIGQVRSILCCWISTATSRVSLRRMDLGELWGIYPGPIAEVENGVPFYFAPNVGRVVVGTDKDGVGAFFDKDGAAPKTTDSVIFLPPNSADSVVEIWGQYYTPNLASDSDTSYFTERYPDTLLYAAHMKLASFHQDRSGVEHFVNLFNLDMMQIDADVVMQESNHIKEFKG